MRQTDIERVRPDRILVIDDDQSVHDAYRKALGVGESADSSLRAREGLLFGESIRGDDDEFQIDSAYQGQEGLERIREAAQSGQPYAMAFVDMRMPPGLDGLETILRIWEEFPGFQIVLCTAYSDYTWNETIDQLGRTSDLLILKKPFEVVEVRQMACALIDKTHLKRQANLKMRELEEIAQKRSESLKRLCLELEAATRTAEAASKTKSEFLANMSHEIRTPMTAILGFTELVLENVSTPENVDGLKTIQRNGEYLLEVINDILDIAKIESGKLEVERIQCSPCEILTDVASLMRVRSAERGLRLQVEYDGPMPRHIQSDPTRLRQILINLVGNAIKFTEVGTIRLVARLLDADSDESTIQFTVVDTGIGLTDEQIGKLFEPFVQADSSTTREFGGSGLGLAISKRLAEMLGGEICVDSVPGEGSTFSVTVPTGSLEGVRLVDNPAAAKITTGRVEKPADGDTRLKHRVLLAEDSRDNQRLISFILNKAGADVAVAENGQIALDLALAASDKGIPFDVILMDMQMPVLDGYEATGKLREAGYSGPIIALTAHAMNSDRDRCINAGCDDFATKPIDRKKLTSLISQYKSQQTLPELQNVLG